MTLTINPQDLPQSGKSKGGRVTRYGTIVDGSGKEWGVKLYEPEKEDTKVAAGKGKSRSGKTTKSVDPALAVQALLEQGQALLESLAK